MKGNKASGMDFICGREQCSQQKNEFTLTAQLICLKHSLLKLKQRFFQIQSKCTPLTCLSALIAA